MAMDVALLEILGSVAGQPVANVIALQSDEADNANPGQQAKALIDIWLATANVAYLACLPDDYSQHGFRARRVNNTGGPSAALPNADNGTRGDNAIASGTGPCIIGSYFDTLDWKSSRLFIPGVAVGDLVGNVFDAALIAAVNTFKAFLIDPLPADADGHVWTPGVWRRTAGEFSLLVSNSVSLVVGTQRRRYRPV